MHTHIEDRENIWMVKRRERPGFLLKSFQPPSVAGELARQNFERHVTGQSWVMRAIHLAHAPGANFASDLVLIERPADHLSKPILPRIPSNTHPEKYS